MFLLDCFFLVIILLGISILFVNVSSFNDLRSCFYQVKKTIYKNKIIINNNKKNNFFFLLDLKHYEF